MTSITPAAAPPMDSLLLQLGCVIGLLQRDPSSGQVTINTGWFADPLTNLQSIPTAQSQQLLALLDTLVGSASGAALGAAGSDLGGTWYPIQNPDSGKPSGLYLVGTAVAASEGVLAGTQYGVGLLVPWQPGGGALDVTPFISLPLVFAPESGTPSVVLGSLSDHPIRLGLIVSGGSGAFTSGQIGFDGLQITVDLAPNGSPSVDILLLNLNVPGIQPGDFSLSALAGLGLGGVSEWIALVLGMLAVEVEQKAGAGSPAAASLYDLLALIGVTGSVPEPDWTSLAASPASTLEDWLAAICATPATLQAFLDILSCLWSGTVPDQGGGDVTKNVSGTGSPADPFAVTLFSDPDSIAVQLTVGVQTQPGGGLLVYPGLTAVTVPVTPVTEVAAQIVCSVQLMEIALAGAQAQKKAVEAIFPSFDLYLQVINPTAGPPLFQWTGSGGTAGQSLTIQSARAGVGYSGSASFAPFFALDGVASEYGSWASVDLTNFDSTVQQILTSIVESALTSFFSAEGDALQAAGALLGIIAPPGLSTWPADAPLLPGAQFLPILLHAPLPALGAWYSYCLTNTDTAGAPLFADLLPSLATLLTGSAAAPGSITGSGSAASPWLVPLSASDGLTANLAAWQAPASPDGGGPALTFGIQIVVPISASAIAPSLTFTAGLVTLALPDTTGAGGGAPSWLPLLSAGLTVTGPEQDGSPTRLSLPGIAGVTLSAAQFSAGCLWTGAFSWTAGLSAVEVAGGGSTVDVGDLLIGEGGSASIPSDLANDLDTLAGLTTAATGMALLVDGGRIGTLAATALGLLPDLPTLYKSGVGSDTAIVLPSGVTLPAGWPTIEADGSIFTDPWTAVLAQLGTLFASGSAFAAPLMQILGWAATGTVPAAGTASGTAANPWSAPLGLGPLDALLWSSGTGVGAGAGAQLAAETIGNVSLTITARLDLGVLPSGSSPQPVSPALTVQCTLANADAADALVGGQTGSELTIGSAVFGLTISLDSTGALTAVPSLVLDGAAVGVDAETTTVTIQPGSSTSPGWTPHGVAEAAFETLLNALMQTVSAASPGSRLLTPFLALLTDVNIAQNLGGSTYGINPGGWTGLMADPLTYLTGQGKAIAASPTLTAALFSHLGALIGFQPPAGWAWKAVPDVLAAFGLMRDTGGGWVPVLPSWLQLVRNPVAYLEQQVQSLTAGNAMQQLLTSVGNQGLPTGTLPLGPFTFQASALPAGVSFSLTAAVTVAGTTVLDIGLNFGLSGTTSGPALTAGLTLGIPALAQDILLTYSFADGSGAFATTLAADPSIPAPFPPIQIYPFAADTGALAEQVALTVLAQGAGRLLSQKILPKSPVATALVKGIGLAATDGAGNLQVKWLLPALLHPVEWLLGSQALGTATGELDLGKLGTLLAALPGTGTKGPGGLTLKSAGTDGLALAGLPYGVGLTLSAATASGIGLTLTVAPSLPESLTATLTGGLSWLPASGLAWNASVGFGVPVGSETLGASIDYAETGGLTISAKVPTGTSDVDLTIVPFPGFNALAQQFLDGTDVGGLLEIVATRIAAAWQAHNQKPSAPIALAGSGGGIDLSGLVSAFQKVGADIGMTSVSSVLTVLQSVKSDPLSQILSWFTGSNSAQLIKDLQSLLGTTLGIQAVTVESGLLTYGATIKGSGYTAGIDIGFGPATSKDGTALALSLNPQLTISALTVAAGAAVSLSTSAPETIDASVTASITADIAAATGESFAPTIELDFGLAVIAGTVGSPSLTVAIDGAFQTLDIDILPNVQLALGAAPGTQTDLGTWLEALGLTVVLPAAVNTLLANGKVAAFLNAGIGSSQATAGGILKNAGLVTTSGTGSDTSYTLADFPAMTPEAFALKLLTGALTAFVPKTGTATLLDFGSGRGTLAIAGAAQDGGETLYGVNVTLTGVTVGSSDPTVTLQLGNWLTGDTAAQSWVTRSDQNAPAALTTPGLTVYFLEVDGSGNQSFHIAIDLISVGLDVAGSAAKPLLSSAGYGVQGVEARLLLSVDQDCWSSPTLGGAVRLDGVSVPLGPTVAGTSSSAGNPVAQSLLTSGQTSSGSTGDAVNPSFSASASYVDAAGGGFDLQFYDSSGNPTNELQIPVNRAFGPLNCVSIGLGASTQPISLDVGFTGSVNLSLLDIALQNLSVSIPLTEPQDFDDYGLSLGGLNVSAGTADVKLSGALLQQGSGSSVAYTGEFMIETPALSLAGVGSYAVLPGGMPSLFAYVQVTPSTPLGGPPFFFVTGLAGGFGFNRGLTLPQPSQVADFPLVSIAASGTQTSAQEVLTQLGTMAPVQRGSYWLAAGVQFTSFQMIDTDAVLAVIFGDDLEIALLGTSTLILPQGDANPYVQAILDIDVVVDVDQGSIEATAILAQNSYVFDPACHLTGGFAFYAWFAGPHSGDFAITLGGYHPQFTPPSWYPSVPRLGLSWSPGGGVSITGQAYFALCPSAVMAGGSLSATYSSGPLKAWLDIEADFLVRWNPFSYDIGVSISVGASLRIKILFTITITVEMSARLQLWGPPFAGIATVSWSVLSFSVDIGDTDDTAARSASVQTMDWSAFASAFLPQSPAPSTLSAAAVKQTDASPGVILCRFKAIAGLVGTADDGWIVDGDDFVMGIELVAPVSTVSWLGSTVSSIQGPTIGIPSMGLSAVTPQLNVTCDNADSTWTVAGVTTSAAGNLWSTLPLSELMTPANAATTVPDAVTAVTATGTGGGPVDASPVMALAGALLNDTLSAATIDPPSPQVVPQAATVSTTAIGTVAATVAAVAGARSAILSAAAGLTGLVVSDGPLTVMAAQAETLFQGQPMLGPVGSWPVADETTGAGSIPVTANAAANVANAGLTTLVARPAADTVAMARPAPRIEAAFLPTVTNHPLAGGTGLVIHRRTFPAHPEELATLAKLAPSSADPTGRAMSLHPGATLVWRIPGGAPAVIDLNGDLPVRVVAIGSDGLPVLDSTVPAGAPSSITLPMGTAQLALEALETATGEPAGWSERTPLRQISGRTALGPGCVLRAQSETLRRSQGARVSTGVVTGSAWAEGCTALNAAGQSLPGWITTCLPAGTAMVTVTLCPLGSGTPEAGGAVPAQAWLPRPASGPPPSLTVMQAVTAPDGSVTLTYAVAGLAGGPAGVPVAVSVRPQPGWRLAGVAAGASAAEAKAPPPPMPTAPRTTATLTVSKAA